MGFWKLVLYVEECLNLDRKLAYFMMFAYFFSNFRKVPLQHSNACIQRTIAF